MAYREVWPLRDLQGELRVDHHGRAFYWISGVDCDGDRVEVTLSLHEGARVEALFAELRPEFEE